MEQEFSNPFENNSAIPNDVQEKLSKIIEKYQQMSKEEKEQFQQGAFDVITKALHKLPRDTILPMWLAPYQSYILFIVAVLIVAFPLVIVARRLYRRMRDREQHQEEKRRLKQQKAEMKKKKKKT